MDGNKWRPETDAELAARLVTKRDERIKELESRISEPVKSFGTPELVAWAEKLQHILADFPEEERGELPFIFTMGNHLEKFAKSWNSPAMRQLQDENAGLRSRVAELDELSDNRRHKIKQMAAVLGGLRQENAGLREALVEERAKAEFLASKYHKDYEFFTYVWDKADGETAIQKAVALDKARAALGGESSDLVAVPSDTLDWIFRSLCAYLDYFGVDSRCYDPKEAAEAIRPYTSLGNPSETPISSGMRRDDE